MQRGNHTRSKLDPRRGVLCGLEGGHERLALPAGAGRQEQIGESGAGIAKHIHVHIEVQGLQGRLALQRITVAEQWVAGERDQSLHWVGALGQNGAIHLVCLHEAWVHRWT